MKLVGGQGVGIRAAEGEVSNPRSDRFMMVSGSLTVSFLGKHTLINFTAPSILNCEPCIGARLYPGLGGVNGIDDLA